MPSFALVLNLVVVFAVASKAAGKGHQLRMAPAEERDDTAAGWLEEHTNESTPLAENESDAMNERDGRRLVSVYNQSLRRLNAIVNVSALPCADFFAHACGNYAAYMEAEEQKGAAASDGAVPPFLINRQDRLNFFHEHKHEFATAPGRIVADLYDDCKQRQQSGRGGNKGRRRQQKQRNNWEHVLHDVDFLARGVELYRQWPLMPFQVESLTTTGSGEAGRLDWTQLAAEMAAHGMPTFMHIFFAEQTIFIEAAEVPAGCLNLRALLSTLLPTLNGRHQQIAIVVAHELWWFCRELNGEGAAEDVSVVEEETVEDERETAGVNFDAVEKKANASDETTEGEDQSTLLQLDVYLKYFFVRLQLTVNDIVPARKIPLDVPKLARILRFLRRTQPRIILNFLLWRAYTQLTTIDCYELTEEFDVLLQAEYWDWHVFQPSLSRDVALGIYSFQMARFQQLRHQQQHQGQSRVVNWDEYLLQRRRKWPTAAMKCDHHEVASLIRYYAERFLQPRQLDRVYGCSSRTDDGRNICNNRAVGNFYGALLRVRRRHLQYTFHMPHIDAEDSDEAVFWLRHFLQFAITLLRQPHYHNFATHNRHLWQTHARQLGLYNSDTLQASSYCLEMQQYDNIAANETVVVPLSDAEVEKIVNFALSFRAAYDDYQFWVEAQAFGFAEHFFLAHFGQDGQRVLFYAVAQQLCGRNDGRYGPQVNQAFRNLPAFEGAFNCSADEGMNPVRKCFDGI